MTIKIDKNIPFPKNLFGKNMEYPFHKMNKTDSFLFKKIYSRKEMKRASSICIRFTKNYGGKFAVAKYKKGIRIWKIKNKK